MKWVVAALWGLLTWRLALRVCSGRCREIPEALDTTRVLIRQVAIVKQYVDGRWNADDASQEQVAA